MAYTDIDDPSIHFHTQLYTGNGSADRDITNDANSGDFKPDWLWIKSRSLGGNSHHLFNSNVGMPNNLNSDEAYAEGTATNKATAFNTNGFRVQTHSTVNQSSATYVAWQWKANGGTTTTNDASATGIGTHDSIYQANTTAGFSIVTWTGNAEPETLAHGLGGTPEMIIIKNRTDGEGWWVGATPAGAMSDGKYLALNNTDAVATNSTSFVNQNPTSTVFRLGGSNSAVDAKINGNGKNILAYLFRSIQGYSKINTYIGSGSTNGTFVYTGFKPAWVLYKKSSAAENWHIVDNKRDTLNPNSFAIDANNANAEANDANLQMDFLSNGFKLRTSHSTANGSGATYIYYAVAESPFCSSKGVPTTAR